tara:strand:- start:59 stop:331 length:273 start_codon:yes stop_codon:yes gene_type:complete
MEAQGAVEVGAIVLSSIGMIGGILMAIVKTIEKNGSIVKCNCCCGSCECDLRQPETRQMVAKLEMEREINARKLTTTHDKDEMIEININD